MHYPAVDNHSAEHVAIAAEPFNTPEKAAIFHINYSRYDVLPIRIIVTNNGDTPISLTEARIDFITAAGDKIPAAEPSDVERILSRPSDLKSGVKLGPLTLGKHKSQDKAIEEDFSRYEYAAIAVEPHTTRAGFLFYNLQNLHDPLVGGRLELRKLHASNGHELFAFEIPFDKYLATSAPDGGAATRPSSPAPK